jgi:uncharacterized membrane protein
MIGIIKKIICAFCVAAVFLPVLAMARENVDYWYIKDFQTEIVANKDSSLLITEKITADCGSAIGKHGIFRILPIAIKMTSGEKVKTPVKLISITDFSGKPLKYQETKNKFENTITWKIGDANKEARGENFYLIKYRVENAIGFENTEFDELYWNLSGNFWDLEIDSFSAKIIFPKEIKEDNSRIYVYSGALGEKGNRLSFYKWSASNILQISSTKTLKEGEGITASIIFPKNIFTPYVPGFWEKYGNYFSFLIPFLALGVCLYFWNRYGRDPKSKNPIIAEYDIPENLSPLELGLLKKNGILKKEFITAEIIGLAVAGFIKIEETDEKFLIFHNKNFEFSKISLVPAKKLTKPQEIILENIFQAGEKVKLSDLRNKFYACLREVKEKALDLLAEKNLFVKSSLKWQIAFIIFGVFFLGGGFASGIVAQNLFWGFGVAAAGLVFIIFSFIMPRRTIQGSEVYRQIKGFELYMETAEKYRQQFYEKENIFEKFLPYAIVFGITELWIKKMKEIYGEDFYKGYAPVWYAGHFGSFDAGSLNSAISGLSSSISANTSSPSGAGGAGGAGGGGGGGGGGGW